MLSNLVLYPFGSRLSTANSAARYSTRAKQSHLPGTTPVDFLTDAKATGDRVEQVDLGVQIEKVSGRANASCGIVLKQGAKDALTLSIELETVQLTSPRSPGLQGLMIQFVFDRPSPNVSTVGLVRTNKGEIGFVFFSDPEPKLNEIPFLATPFSKGTLHFKRESGELRFSIGETSGSESMPVSYREIRRIPIGTEPLKEVRMVVRRQDSAKPVSSFLLKRLRFFGDDYYAQPGPKPPYWTAKRIYSALFWTCVLFVIAFTISRAPKIKAWLESKMVT